MRKFVIGDIHGAHKALVQCLERCGFDRRRDRLITIGDICDGWNEVRQCVDELLTIDNRIDIIGNHDEWFRQFLATGVHLDPLGAWKQGGEGTYTSYLPEGAKWLLPEDVPESHQRFFNHQKLYYIDDERNCIFVHGGFDRFRSIEESRRECPSNFYWDRELWEEALSCKVGKLQTIDDFDEIFIGHTSTTCWRTREVRTEGGIIIPKGEPITTPMNSAGVWNIDTGAGWNGKLTIMDIDTKEYWRSDFVSTIYPDKAARKF